MKFIFIFFLIYSHLTSAAEICIVKESFNEIKKLSKEMSPILSLTSTQDIEKFCQINGLRDTEESFGAVLDINSADGRWEKSFIATHDFRTANFISYFYKDSLSSDSPNGKISPELANKKRQEVFQIISKRLYDIPETISEELKDRFIAAADRQYKSAADQESDIEAGTLKAAYACSDLTMLNAKGCIDGLAKIQKIAKPVGGITLIPVWKEVVQNPLYMKVFKAVSLKIMTHISEKTVPNLRLFDEIQSEFLKQGKNKMDAAEMTWKTMGLLATGGGNVAIRSDFIGQNLSQLNDVLHVLSNGAMLLDRQSATKGFLFTYPKEVNNICDYGKNYHFWMTAYLAREVAKETQNVKAAAAAAYSADKGYQFAKRDAGRDPRKPFTQETFSNYNNNMRLDLSLASAGAWFGATSLSEQKTISREKVDQALRLTFEGSEMLPRRNQEELNQFLENPMKTIGFYSDWKKIINPDASYKFYAKEFGYK